MTKEEKAAAYDELHKKHQALEKERAELMGVIEGQTKTIEALEQSKKAGVEVINVGKVPHKLVVPSFHYDGKKWDAAAVREADKETLEALVELHILEPAGKEDN